VLQQENSCVAARNGQSIEPQSQQFFVAPCYLTLHERELGSHTEGPGIELEDRPCKQDYHGVICLHKINTKII
jgi:hypothetical protein